MMGLKLRFANRTLNSRLASVSRRKKVLNLDSAKTAGILWDIDHKEIFDKIVKDLWKAGVKASGLCYFPLKKVVIPDNIIGFSRKQTSWFEIPKSQVADDFIHQKFDLLIDLTGQKYFPMIYVTALSEARFKVGYSGNPVNYFDLTIEFGEQPETKKLAEQILYYLKRINKTSIE